MSKGSKNRFVDIPKVPALKEPKTFELKLEMKVPAGCRSPTMEQLKKAIQYWIDFEDPDFFGILVNDIKVSEL